jgi:hypothetical protein
MRHPRAMNLPFLMARFIPAGAALAAAHTGGLRYNVSLYGAAGAAPRAVWVHLGRSALLVLAVHALALRGMAALSVAMLSFAGTHTALVASLARRP